VAIKSPAGDEQTLILDPVDDEPQQYAATWRRPVAGRHSVVWSPGAGRPDAACEFLVEADSRELRELGVDAADLREAARLGGGQALDWSDVDRLFDELPAGQPVVVGQSLSTPLWNRPELLGVFVLLLGLEWWMRRQWRLV
jgi:hypothetical protein